MFAHCKDRMTKQELMRPLRFINTCHISS